MVDTRLSDPVSLPESNDPKIPPQLAENIRRLSHDLSNALEVILQTNYLLEMGGDSSEEEKEKWREMLNRGVAEATRINRELRDFVRGNS